ncbi:hypothetical protein GCM10007159_17020 [Modicisalibacter luteus]|nr:hypothetical protein GCM10007159_17020 [Halomonas lutea]
MLPNYARLQPNFAITDPGARFKLVIIATSDRHAVRGRLHKRWAWRRSQGGNGNFDNQGASTAPDIARTVNHGFTLPRLRSS